MPCYAYQGITPVVDPTTYVHPLASIIGDVIIGPGCFIAPGASLRGDFGRIVIEGESSIQDNVSVHANSDRDTIIRRGATIGHGAVIHGCIIGENSLIGINAIILDDCVIGAENYVAAQALVRARTETPPRAVLMGSPARVTKILQPNQIVWATHRGSAYQILARNARTELLEVEPDHVVSPDRPRIAAEALPVSLN